MPSAQYVATAEALLANAPEQPVLVVKSVAASTEGATEIDEIAVLSEPSALGLGSIAYLVYGIPGTDRYVFFDLNHLPNGYVAKLTLGDSQGNIHSVNHWEGSLGNSPQPTTTE